MNADVTESLPDLKMIAARLTGFDHINLPDAASRGIPVCNVATYGENTVAEYTFALILALSRNLHKAYVRTLAGNFSLDGLQGFDPKGKTLGVVGHIGEYVMRIAKGFGMHLLAYDPVQDMTKADHFDFTYTSLEDLLSRSDIVTLHAPASDASRHLIGTHNIGQFKRGVLLINTARGDFVDTEALGTQPTFEQALLCLRPGGTLSSLGVYSGNLQVPAEAYAAGLGDHRIVTTL
jgi:D-lactate dehydrogenase